MQFSLCLPGHPEQCEKLPPHHPPHCECFHPAWFCIHMVCARRCRSVRIPVRKALWLPHFGIEVITGFSYKKTVLSSSLLSVD